MPLTTIAPGPFLLGHVALVGFFSCAALYAAWTWWLSRRQGVLLIFVTQCVLCAVLSGAYARLAMAQSAGAAVAALSVRFVTGLLAMGVTAVLASRVTGLRPRWYLRGISAVLLAAIAFFVLFNPARGANLILTKVDLPWGETLTVPRWSELPGWALPVYLAVASVNLFVLLGAARLFRTDRTGGVLVGLCGVTGLWTTVAGGLADRGILSLPYMGDLPFAFWVVMIATQFARENAQARARHRLNDQRLRAIFDHTLHFMGLLDVDGRVLEANRPVLDAVGVPPDAVLGHRFWETPIWAHSTELQARVRDACAAAAQGRTVRFETWHPLPSGATGYVDFSVTPITDAGRVILIVPEGRDITERKHTQAALDRIVDVIGSQTGQDFFQTAVDALCGICGTEFALVSAVDQVEPGVLRTIAVSRGGRRQPNFSYDVQHTPCATVIGHGACYYPSGVQALFPEDPMLRDLQVESYLGMPIVSPDARVGGIIAVLDARPLHNADLARAVLHVVAARAGAELERRRVDAALIESESRFRTLVEDIEVGVVLHDRDDRIILSNPAAARVLGLTREQLHGVTSADPGWGLITEDGTPCGPEHIPSVVAARTGQPVRNAIIGVRHRVKGTRTWLQVTAAPRLRADGALMHVLVTMVDVTDRKRAEEAVRASSRRLALAISATSDAVWEWNYQTGDTYYSPRWFEMLGLPPDTPMTVDTFRSLCHPDDLEPTFVAIERALAPRDTAGYEVEFRMRHGNGTWVWVLGRGNAVERDAQGRPAMVAGTNTDITQRKDAEARRRELEARLAQSHRMESMGRLAGGVAHDFNNILTVINGYSDLLLDAPELTPSSIEMLSDIRTAGERAAALTRQLLTFSRHQVVTPDTLELNMVVADTERMLTRLIGEHITLDTRMTPEPLWVKADAGQLSQVLVNLAVNARDAMPDGGTLTVTTGLVDLDSAAALATAHDAKPGRYARLSVADTGTGIPPELRELVFEPFFTTKGPGRGTGLGLTTVHSIVQQCGGMLSVQSEPGAGTRFDVYLPVSDEPAVPEQVLEARPQTVRERKTVLMVEDETAVRHVVQVMLERLGLEVLAATDAQDALRTLDVHDGPIDLLLTDIIMPGLNGRQLAEQVQARRPGLRVIYMSGYTDDAVVQQVVLHADALYIQKPFDSDAIARKVRQALDGASPAGGNTGAPA